MEEIQEQIEGVEDEAVIVKDLYDLIEKYQVPTSPEDLAVYQVGGQTQMHWNASKTHNKLANTLLRLALHCGHLLPSLDILYVHVHGHVHVHNYVCTYFLGTRFN